MNTSVMILIIMGLVGLTFGLILAFANRKFAVETNPLIHLVEEVLPKGQCGACGYAGCLAYAEAVVLNPEVSPNLCVPGKEAVAKQVAGLTGKTAAEIEPRIAHVKCAGGVGKAVLSFNYSGIRDCAAANLVKGGPKGCKHGCIGFGTCVKGCAFNALTMSEEGLPVVNPKKCMGCGICETVCPKKVIQMLPVDFHAKVDCNSRDKGPVARKLCTAACIGCGICVKNCGHGAVKLVENLAVVDSRLCIEQCSEATCLAKCPTKAINCRVVQECGAI